MSAHDPKTHWREYKATASVADMSVVVAGSFTLEPIEPYLGAHLVENGFSPALHIAPFGQLFQLCHDYKSTLGVEKSPDVLALFWRMEDMFPHPFESFLAGSPDSGEALMREVIGFADAIKTLRKNFAGTLIVSSPPYPLLNTTDVLDLQQPLAVTLLHQKVTTYWLQEMAQLDRVKIIDAQGLLLQNGIQASYDARKWYLYRQPFTEKFWQMAGRQLGRLICAEKISAKKCIVLDCDNTLWGGIIGEDGLGGIQIGNEFTGSAFRDFQKHLLLLKQHGIMLAVASKNNPEDVAEVFEKHTGMVLKKSDITVFEVHWNSKVDSIRRIAETLNIGLNALVFIDDSPKEISEVQERLPEVTCLTVPEELSALPAFLTRVTLFDTAEITDEDRKRTEMMAAEQERKGLQSTLSEQEFKASLGLQVRLFEAEEQHLARITQLINKTNQFNMTTRRRTQDDVEALHHSATHMVLGMDIRDKFGDYGLVGVAILEKKDSLCVIDTLLMSCRVLGRDAETAFIALIAKAAEALGCTSLQGDYIATQKNAMVKELYLRHGFTQKQNTAWMAELTSVTANPAHIQAALILKSDTET